MDIQEIKAFIANETKLSHLATAKFELGRQYNKVIAKEGDLNKDGSAAKPGDEIEVKSEWLSHWDNAGRVRVVFHEEIANKLKANPLMGGLALKPMEVVAAHGTVAEYRRYIVIMPTNIELSI